MSNLYNFCILRINENNDNFLYKFLDAGRRKRDLTQFGHMIYSSTGRDPFEFIDYGNWCGLGGNGSVIDAIDEYVIVLVSTNFWIKKLWETGTKY